MRPSDNWTSCKVEPAEERQEIHHTIQTVIASLNFFILCSRATRIRKDYEGDDVPCYIDTERYQSGWFNVVFEIVFDDGVVWIARVQLPPTRTDAIKGAEDDSARKEIMKSEVVTMRYVKAHTTIPVPEVYDFNTEDSTAMNPIGYPCILMEPIEGRILQGTFGTSVPKRSQEQVLDMIANYIIQLSNLRFSMIGLLVATTNF